MLETVSLFNGLPGNALDALARMAVKKEVPAGAIVISEGESTDSLYILVKGRAQAVCNDQNGKQIILNVFEPADFFGEMSFFDSQKRSATVMTVKPSELLVIPRRAFREFMTGNPDIAFNMIGDLVCKLRTATRQIEDLAFMDVYGRVVRFLTEAGNENGVIAERLTHQEIGNRVGASRETVSRIMAALLKEGYIEKKKLPGFSRQVLVIRKNIPYQV